MKQLYYLAAQSKQVLKAFCFIFITIFVTSCSEKINIEVIENYDQYLQKNVPVIYINTPGEQAITSKEEYVNDATIRIVEDGVQVFNDVCSIKGRGNSTWNQDKKPYRIKFKEKQSILSLPEDKSWILLANYFDPSQLRNDLTLFMGKALSSLDFTPSFKFVWLVLNGENKGIYQIGERIEVSKNRVNIGKEDFLLEIDGLAPYEEDSNYFYVDHIEQPINIKEPKVKENDENFLFIKDVLTKAENSLFSVSFSSSIDGWRQFFDINSLIDYYIISEITKNSDTFNWSSTFMTYKRGGQIKMGPLWDFDRGLGNYFKGTLDNRDFEENDPEGYFIKKTPWYARLFEDPQFVEAVKERYSFFWSHKEVLLNRIDYQSRMMEQFIVEENKLWGMIADPEDSETQVIEKYRHSVNHLKDWLVQRMGWLNSRYNVR